MIAQDETAIRSTLGRSDESSRELGSSRAILVNPAVPPAGGLMAKQSWRGANAVHGDEW